MAGQCPFIGAAFPWMVIGPVFSHTNSTLRGAYSIAGIKALNYSRIKQQQSLSNQVPSHSWVKRVHIWVKCLAQWQNTTQSLQWPRPIPGTSWSQVASCSHCTLHALSTHLITAAVRVIIAREHVILSGSLTSHSVSEMASPVSMIMQAMTDM